MIKKLQVASVVFLLIVGGLLLWYTPALLPAASTAPPGRPSDRKPEFYFSTPESIEFCKLLDSSDANATIRLQQLIKDGLDINVRGKYGMTLLAWAFYRDNRVIFQHLLEAGADPYARFTEKFDWHLLGEVKNGETVPELAARLWLNDYKSELSSVYASTEEKRVVLYLNRYLWPSSSRFESWPLPFEKETGTWSHRRRVLWVRSGALIFL